MRLNPWKKAAELEEENDSLRSANEKWRELMSEAYFRNPATGRMGAKGQQFPRRNR